MARAPRPGEAKTRLEQLLGPAGCARLQAELIRHTAGWASTHEGKAWLAFTPAGAREEVAGLVPASVSLFAQEGRDLGERLRHASAFAFRAHPGALILIGTDAPQLGLVHVGSAERALAAGYDACLVPAIDGGYALIALARPTPQAFELPPAAWGGHRVLELTVRALRRSGRACKMLEPVGDLDCPDDAMHMLADARCPPAIRDALGHRAAA